MNKPLIAFAVLLATLATAGPALADGGPANAVAGPDGVTTPKSDVRYVTLGAGRSTVVAAIQRNGGQVVRSTLLRGSFEVPGVTTTGSAGGLSAKGDTLVLVRQFFTFPQRRSVLAILDPIRMRVTRTLNLSGQFSFDAMSPDGRLIYLIQYLSADQTHYAVRAYDAGTGRLRKGPIVDPNEHGDEMRGYPLLRAYSPDGRWAYTMYDGNGKHPFIHALDTVAGRAKCIDAPMLAGRQDLYDLTLRMGPGGGPLSVVGKHGPLAIVDTRTFRVSTPAHPRAAGRSTASGGGVSWMPFAFAGLLLTGGAVALGLRRRRRLATG
jgi:hypothetical protein